MATGLRKNMVLNSDGRFLRVLDFKEVKGGQMRPKVHLTLKDMKTGSVLDRTLDSLGHYEEVACTIRTVRYLYAANKEYVFMDTETFDQVPLSESFIGPDTQFLVTDEEYRMMMLGESPLGLELPPVVTLRVTDTAPPSHGGPTGNVFKDATMETGLRVKVPLFIKAGDKIRVDRESHQYAGKENE